MTQERLHGVRCHGRCHGRTPVVEDSPRTHPILALNSHNVSSAQPNTSPARQLPPTSMVNCGCRRSCAPRHMCRGARNARPTSKPNSKPGQRCELPPTWRCRHRCLLPCKGSPHCPRSTRCRGDRTASSLDMAIQAHSVLVSAARGSGSNRTRTSRSHPGRAHAAYYCDEYCQEYWDND